MIHFPSGSEDGRLVAELKDAGILTPDVLVRIDRAMGNPETGTLDAMLAAGATLISEPEWLSWLIRRNGCHRFGRVRPDEPGLGTAWSRGPDDGNFAYRATCDGLPVVAVSRPDRKEATARRLNCDCPRWGAATLSEISALRAGRDRRHAFDPFGIRTN